jgi:hypothetical protein
MRDDEYRRLHAACLAMAKQSTEPDLQARWMAAADTWLKLATEQRFAARDFPFREPAEALSLCCPDMGHSLHVCSGKALAAVAQARAFLYGAHRPYSLAQEWAAAAALSVIVVRWPPSPSTLPPIR